MPPAATSIGKVKVKVKANTVILVTAMRENVGVNT